MIPNSLESWGWIALILIVLISLATGLWQTLKLCKCYIKDKERSRMGRTSKFLAYAVLLLVLFTPFLFGADILDGIKFKTIIVICIFGLFLLI